MPSTDYQGGGSADGHAQVRTVNAMLDEMLDSQWVQWGRVELSESRRGAPA